MTEVKSNFNYSPRASKSSYHNHQDYRAYPVYIEYILRKSHGKEIFHNLILWEGMATLRPIINEIAARKIEKEYGVRIVVLTNKHKIRIYGDSKDHLILFRLQYDADAP